MNIILTGITGNLGHEISIELNNNGHTVIPIVKRKYPQLQHKQVIINDLTSDTVLDFKGYADCIIHSAGNIHFLKSADSNTKMTNKLITLAKKLEVPLYLVSTAYIYRPPDLNEQFHNAYELDKSHAEQLLRSTGLEYDIFRPSVLVGNSDTGSIQNFSGYYSIAKAFYLALTESKKQNKKVRFPSLPGKSNFVPVNQAAQFICRALNKPNSSIKYITNKNPPQTSFVLSETLDFFNLKQHIELVEMSFEEYGMQTLTDQENKLYQFIKYYYPYWVIPYNFPDDTAQENLITHDYLIKTLTFFTSSESFKT